MYLIYLQKPDDKVQIFYNNLKFSKTSNQSTITGSKDYKCTNP